MVLIRNKKAFLLGEETLKIIIAVIAIGLLVFLLFKIYYGGKESEQLDQAQASLDHFVSELDSGAEIIEIYNPQSTGSVDRDFWWFTIFGSEEPLPKACSSYGWDRCVCICEGRYFGESSQSLANLCDEKGVCENFVYNFSFEGSGALLGLAYTNLAEIDNPPLVLNVDHDGKKITEK